MKKCLIITLVCVLAATSIVFWQLAAKGGTDPNSGLLLWVKVFRDNLRTPLFTGFFTLGGFLLTLKSAILMRIKEIYDTDDYETKWKVWKEQEERAGNGHVQCDYYSPLRNLGLALLANVILSLLTSFLQMTIGFIDHPLPVGICLGFAMTTLCLIIFLWFQISANLMMWFEHIELEKKAEMAARDSRSKEKMTTLK